MPGSLQLGQATLPSLKTALLCFPSKKVNIIQLSVGTNKLIAFNESNNLKELSIYLPLSAAWLVHRSASSTGSNSIKDMISILQAGTALEIVF